MCFGIVDIEKVKIVLDSHPETIEYAVSLIETEIKSIEYLVNNGIHIEFEE